ncbi:MAG TPA: BrxA/BrxB family bacilliredoxin [Candidatus Acidoferrales bacterium]|jgi:putative YphP/YqiW family bacilliredoxin|nr:BrxA/BrxB family bacilliredoxin [Candidatus Acidoferrales bacterium]
MFPEDMVSGMREELTRVGFREMRTPADVDSVLKQEKRTVLVVVNSVCGCAAGKARPAIAQALSNKARPEVLATVFAGQDLEATKQARSYFTGYAPSSPSIALLRDGKVEFMMERRDIESSDPFTIAAALTRAFDRICAPTAAPVNP